MNNSLITQRYCYIIHMIEQSHFNSHGIPQKFFDEDPEKPHSLFYQIREACTDEFSQTAELDAKLAFRILSAAISKYLLRYPATVSVRQRLYQHIWKAAEGLSLRPALNGAAEIALRQSGSTVTSARYVISTLLRSMASLVKTISKSTTSIPLLNRMVNRR